MRMARQGSCIERAGDRLECINHGCRGGHNLYFLDWLTRTPLPIPEFAALQWHYKYGVTAAWNKYDQLVSTHSVINNNPNENDDDAANDSEDEDQKSQSDGRTQNVNPELQGDGTDDSSEKP